MPGPDAAAAAATALGAPEELLCPSFAPLAPGKGMVFAIVAGTPAQPRSVPLARPEPVTEEVFRLAAPLHPSEIFRIAAPCKGCGCKNFAGGLCHLGKAVAQRPAVVDDLPSCRIRPRCLWWHQEGKAACLTCPMVVSNNAVTLERRIDMGR